MGFEQGRAYREETMDILTREAENSDSLEVALFLVSHAGLHADAQHCGRNRIRNGFFSFGEPERCLPKEAHPDLLCLS